MTPDLSVCTEKNDTISNYEKQSPFYVRSDYPDRQGTSSIFRKVREKISALKPLAVWIFAVAISPPKAGNRFLQSCPPAKTTSKRPQACFAPLFLPRFPPH